MDINAIFSIMIEKNATDAFVKANGLMRMRIFGDVRVVSDHRFSTREVADLPRV